MKQPFFTPDARAEPWPTFSSHSNAPFDSSSCHLIYPSVFAVKSGPCEGREVMRMAFSIQNIVKKETDPRLPLTPPFFPILRRDESGDGTVPLPHPGGGALILEFTVEVIAELTSVHERHRRRQ